MKVERQRQQLLCVGIGKIGDKGIEAKGKIYQCKDCRGKVNGETKPKQN